MMARSELFRRYCLVVGLIITASLAACDESGELTAQDFIARAEEHLAKSDRSASIIELKNALQKEPGNTTARLLLGKVYLEVGHGPGAEKEVTRARDLGADVKDYAIPQGRSWLLQGKYQSILDEIVSGSADTASFKAAIHSLRGQAHLGLNDIEAAGKEFEASLEEDSGNIQAFVGLAQLSLRRNEAEAAKEWVDQAVARGPAEPDVLAIKGAFQFATGNFVEAEAFYKALVKARPENLRHRLPLANTQVMSGKPKEAAETLAPILKLAPKHPAANYLRSLAAYRGRDYEAAKNYVQTVLAASPGHAPSLLIAGASSYALEEFEQANTYLNMFLAKTPGYEPATRLHGATLLRLGRTGQALAALKPLADRTSDDAQLLAMVGMAAMRSGDFEAGRKYFKRYAALRPDDSDTRARIGALELGLGNLEKGIEELQRAVELDPGSDRALISLFAAQIRATKFDDALTTAGQVQANRPDAPDGYTLEGIAYLGKRNEAKARAAFSKALEIKPGSPDASASLAALENRAGNSDKAREYLTEALKNNPGHLATIVRLAQVENTLGDREATRKWLELAVQSNPEPIGPKILLARFYVRGGRAVDALRLTDDALRSDPQNASLLTIVGQAQFVAGRLAEAAETFRSLVKVRTESAEAHFLLAAAYGGQRDWRRQETELQEALRIDSRHLRAKLELGKLSIRKRNLDEAASLLAELKNAAPEDARVLALDAGLAAAQGRYSDAVTIYRRASEQRSTTDWTLGLANAQWRLGDRDDSFETLEKWLQRVPQDLRVRGELAMRYLIVERYGPAKSNFEKIVEATPNNWVAQNNLAWLHWKSGNAETALPHAERALDLAPNDAGVMDTAGSILLDIGHTERAVRILRSAVEGAPKNADIRFHLAKALAKTSEIEEARILLRAVLSGTDKFSERPAAERLLEELGG